MNGDGLARGVMDALPEPAFLLGPTGEVMAANRAARGLLGDKAVSGNLADRLDSPQADVDRYLARSAGTSGPLPGALVFRTPAGTRRFRTQCSRLSGQPEAVLLLRCIDPREDRFSILTEHVRQLDSELRQRVREKAVLSEALAENRNLMRELQHRVKNNIQMMISLLSMSAANNDNPDVRAFVNSAKDRFRALATTQDLIYEAQNANAIPARELLGRLGRALGESVQGNIQVEVDVIDAWLPQDSAHCLALIANELVTNSVKHAFDGGAGRIRISLERDGDQLRMTVRDDGRGYPALDPMPRSSGLTLIRGLCRQIGAGLELRNDGGACSTLVFRVPRMQLPAGENASFAPTVTLAST